MAIVDLQDVRFQQIFAFRLDLMRRLVYGAGSMKILARYGHVGEGKENESCKLS